MGFYAHVGELSKVLIEGCHRCIFGGSCSGEQAVDEMDLRCSVAFQCVEVNRRITAVAGIEQLSSGLGMFSWSCTRQRTIRLVSTSLRLLTGCCPGHGQLQPLQ